MSRAMFLHELRLSHRREPVALRYGEPDSRSEVDVNASSSDLTEAWAELLSRLPSDVYAALKAAMAPEEVG